MFFNYRKLALALPLALGLGACDKGLESLNVNPNNPTTGDPAYILTNAERANIYRLFDTPASMDGGLLIIQHWAKVQYTDEDRYAFRATSYQSIWDGFYAGGLQDFNELIRQGQATNNPNLQAVGLIMRSYFFSVLTDIYGDIPYSEALRLSDNILTPKYDTQEQVYTGVIADLKTAAGLIVVNGAAVNGDVLYDGNMANWQRFSNSLRLRLAMRLVDVKPDVARTEVAALLNGTTPVFASNADNAEFTFLSNTPNTNPIYNNRLTRDDYRVSRTLTSRLARLNDPRLSIYANHPECGDSAAFYRGIPNGLTNAAASAFGQFCSSSKVGSYFAAAEAPGVLMTYAEVLFFKAEAIARGFVSGNAATEYQNAIRASMGQYGFSGADVTTYLAQPRVAYNPANYKQSIGDQKWIALYGQGVEAWSEWRRLDYPQLKVAVSPVGAASGKIPVRFRYPANEQTLNTANRTEAVTRQGPDLLTTKLWWDKQ
ncbi:hypothetical protein BXP70_05875 [Hymenobacter crusticola]|uniref:SusD/RagB family nutrient-binding outer membrane lipoprotein n=2 Tax=Hymenobacter crusticola TaxID=1770526 RepID=A0A243WI88_9BACT|nr:hypothetical protein BXP70_05875 [Hymenobacter crusticola]